MADNGPLTIRQEGAVAIIAAPSYISSEGGEQIQTAVTELRGNGTTRVVLNLEGCSMANSVGMSFLIEVLEDTREAGGHLAFCNVTRTLSKTLQIMGLLQTATLHETEDEAVAAAAEGG